MHGGTVFQVNNIDIDSIIELIVFAKRKFVPQWSVPVELAFPAKICEAFNHLELCVVSGSLKNLPHSGGGGCPHLRWTVLISASVR